MSLAIEQAPAQRLRAALRGRVLLEDAFQAAWKRTAPQSDPAALDAWVEGALALLFAHAGPACLAAYFRIPGDPALVGRAGREAAELCRHAGATAALAALDAWPRLGRPDWWAGMARLAREAPDCLLLALAHAAAVLAAVGEAGFADFVALGLRAAGRNRARREAFFALRDALSRRALARGAVPGFEAEERRLKLFITALWGRVPALRPLPAPPDRPPPRRARIADGVVLLPESFPGVPPADQSALFRAAAAHAAAHLTYSAGRQPVGRLKPLQLALIGLVEDARVEALMLRRFPGLRRLWALFHVAAPAGVTAPALMARLSRALLDPDYADPDGFVAKGRALFADADPDDPGMSRRIGGLLGNDLGQMRLQFNPRTYVIEPAYRDDNLGLWDFGKQGEAAAEVIDLMVEAARVREEAGDGRSDPRGSAEGTARARPAAPAEGMVLARYPEWDRAHGVERPDWTCVREVPAPLGDSRRIAQAMDGAPDLRRRIDRLVRAARPSRPQRLRRLPEGTDLDLDAVLDSVMAEASGELPDGRIYRATLPRRRDLASVILIDVSESTRQGGILEVERLAVAALGAAMAQVGDPFALLAFASEGREHVRLMRVKDFGEPFGVLAQAKLAGLAPGLSTRLGAALRHAGAELSRQRSFRRLVLVLTDAEPSDIDVPDRQDLVEDARRAVLRLRAEGKDVFGVVIGHAGAENAMRIFGRAGYVALRRLEDLPARLADLYFRLSRR
jgi:nitric oxide reductase NorD protein